MKKAAFTVALILLFTHPVLTDASGQTTNLAEVKLVRDEATGLTWSTCVLGQKSSDCQGNAARLTWVDALNKARGSESGGVTNWRLPKIEELQAIHRRAYARLDTWFPGIDRSIVWSASANLDYATDAWAFDFSKGEPVVHARDSKLQVLLVSGP